MEEIQIKFLRFSQSQVLRQCHHDFVRGSECLHIAVVKAYLFTCTFNFLFTFIILLLIIYFLINLI